jgi:hypothetical protein
LSRIGGCGQEERKDERVAHRKFLRQWNYFVWFYNAGYVSSVKLIGSTSKRVNPNVNFGLHTSVVTSVPH